jgi:tetratricopeptide (TPR) repeat protein
MIMKKIFLLLAAAIVSIGAASAQEQLNESIKLANDAMEAYGIGEHDLAIEAFKKAITIAEAVGDEGADHANTCKTALCTAYLASSKKLLKAGDYEKALERLNETIATAEAYGAEETVADAQALIPNVYLAQGNNALKAKNMEGAIEAYLKVVEINPTGSDAYLRLGRAYTAAGKTAEAIAAYESAIANGAENKAKSPLATIYLKKAQASKKAQKWQETLDNAEKALSYVESANAYSFAGEAALKLGKSAQCIEFFEKYLEASPNAKNANQIKFQIAETAQKAGMKAKAIEYFSQITSDPNLGAYAAQQVAELKK